MALQTSTAYKLETEIDEGKSVADGWHDEALRWVFHYPKYPMRFQGFTKSLYLRDSWISRQICQAFPHLEGFSMDFQSFQRRIKHLTIVNVKKKQSYLQLLPYRVDKKCTTLP